MLVTPGDVTTMTFDWHSTDNTTWRPLRLIVTYTPGGEEKALEAAPDYHLHDLGTVPAWAQA
jgi:hypothetical protein